MGKRKATRMAILKAGDTEGMKREINDLNVIVNNLQTLLNREAEKTAVLEARIVSLTAPKTKTTTKKAPKKKKSAAETITEE